MAASRSFGHLLPPHNLTGCPFAKGNLVHRDWGKNAFTFWRRSDGKALRIRTRAGAFGSDSDAERQKLFAAVRQGTARPTEEGARFQELHLERARQVLEAPEADLLEFFPVDTPLPACARIHDSIKCADQLLQPVPQGDLFGAHLPPDGVVVVWASV